MCFYVLLGSIFQPYIVYIRYTQHLALASPAAVFDFTPYSTRLLFVSLYLFMFAKPLPSSLYVCLFFLSHIPQPSIFQPSIFSDICVHQAKVWAPPSGTYDHPLPLGKGSTPSWYCLAFLTRLSRCRDARSQREPFFRSPFGEENCWEGPRVRARAERDVVETAPLEKKLNEYSDGL